MNMQAVKKLIIKDLHLNRNLMLKYIIGSFALALVFYCIGELHLLGRLGERALPLITLQVSLAAFGLNILLTTIFRERERGTLPFTMSFPISTADYTFAKIIANIVMFFSIWLIVPVMFSFIFIYIIEVGEPAPNFIDMLAFIPLLFGQMITFFIITLAIALITESLSWTIATAGISGIFYGSGFIYFSEAFFIDIPIAMVIQAAIGIIALVTAFNTRNRRTVLI